VFASGILYHVIVRGNQRQRIFCDDRDRDKYLEILASLKNQFSFRISAYVLMLNHVRLLEIVQALVICSLEGRRPKYQIRKA
jgi:REP element-mobilizing transposase RayT